MANAELISSAISGALGGLHQDYGEQRKLKAQENIERMRAELRAELVEAGILSKENIAGQNNETKVKVAGIGADARTNVAGINASSREAVAGTMSGASLMRVREKIKADSERAAMEEDGRNNRHATASGNVTLAEKGRAARWLNPSGNARLGAATTARGQDLNFSLGSQRDATTQRGQNFSFTLGQDRNAIARAAAAAKQDNDPLNADDPATETEEERQARVASRQPASDVNLPSIFDATFNDPVVGSRPPAVAAPAPSAQPTVAPRPGGGVTRGPIPIAPRTTDTSAKAIETLTAQAEAAVNAYEAEKNPAKRQQLQRQLAELKRRRDALLAAQGGGRQ